MDFLTRAMAALVRLSVRLLPAGRRTWGEAALAEMDDAPPGRERLSWTAGALWMVVREARLIRRVVIDLLAIFGAVTIVIIGWHGDWTNPATPVNRIFLISARIARIGGYTLVFALLPIVIAVGNFAGNRFATCGDCDPAQQAQWYDERVGDAIAGSLLIFVIIVAYAVLVLALTSRRAAMTASSTVIGSGCAVVGGFAVYAIAPGSAPWDLGSPWLTGLLVVLLLVVLPGAPFFSGLLAASRMQTDHATSDLTASRGRQAVLAGVLTATGGVLILTILTIPTMVAFPGSVPLEWANPSPSVPHGTPFELQMSVGDAAARYLLWMVLAPLLGAGLGATGAGAAGRVKVAPPRQTGVSLPAG